MFFGEPAPPLGQARIEPRGLAPTLARPKRKSLSKRRFGLI
jgi:hypothetical protein